MATQINELAIELATIKTLLVEAANELSAKITALEEALGNAGALPEDAALALEDVRIAAQALADVVPNEAPPT